ncbi:MULTISPECIES: HsdM family class I SAM-dependent methyltransferase [Leeuwenhoekiella]|uniref:HsdM family class I SAM-dependent methyltransferase n=3 Tax=Flavobacteriaceae TaxID=49546 RepID=UPI00235511B8|nr:MULTISPECIES: class I SAM-dependent DNA methyltransferase [Leeuwenhoekiella]|tara:strand:+ start:939 stop:2558 length:1620 start_codon:yes stop_codon:yes gene_type:complete
MTLENTNKTKALIDDLKAVCANNGLGNSSSEFDIITQAFLYKYLNDKFTYQLKRVRPDLTEAENWQEELLEMDEDEYRLLELELETNAAFLYPRHLITNVFNSQNDNDFAKTLDDTLLDISQINNQIFSVTTGGGSKIQLFDRITEFVKDASLRDNFARAIINKLVDVNFEAIMEEGFDFFSTIFEYLIKDYNNDSGGKYAEYYTPQAVSKVMAAILVPKPTDNVTIYDPSAGSGTLLMHLAHAIGPRKCTVYSQDISQKSSNLLRLNLILNDLVHSIGNVIQGNTMTAPYHREHGKLRKFDYIVSNPPFKLDFSDDVDELKKKINQDRFFAGVPNVPKKAKNKMAIYSMFLQHIMFSLSERGKAAVVVPTGFITAQSGIDKKIRQQLVEHKMLAGVVSMPSNIFATTGTNVSIVFFDKANDGKVILIDASNLGTTVKEGKAQKTLLSEKEEQKIINSFINKEAVENFSVAVDYEEIKAKNYSLSAGQYFEVKIEYVDITAEEFHTKIEDFENCLESLFVDSKKLEREISQNLKKLRYE